MPTKRTKRARPQVRRITPEAVEAFRRRDGLELHRALGLKPWERSPLDVDLRVKPPTATATGQIAWLETWPQAYMLREALEAAIRGGRRMSTKRSRRARGSALPEEVIEALGWMGGMNEYTTDWLAQQWLLWGDPLREWWRRKFNQEPLIDEIARREGWATRRLPDRIVKFRRDVLS